jgi:hypothetical protein
MIDNYTSLIYGWKISKSNINKFEHELEKVNENWYDDLQEYIIQDHMCGNYLYFGAILAHYDVEEGDDDLVIDDKLISSATKAYNDFINKNPEIDKIFKKYAKGNPQLYLFQNIW